ncbi:MAG TPA: hypothetical protein VK463_13335 [Desulfomonilaceae bacterium]|nr:hypothetical protein [Desulfomonilaceae bacterium]
MSASFFSQSDFTQITMNWESATLLFLIALFAAAEMYRLVRGTRGVITSVSEAGLLAAASVMTVKVKLKGGDEIDADLNCCTACIGRLKVGDEVRVCPTRDGYVVDLPWTRRSSSRDLSGACS